MKSVFWLDIMVLMQIYCLHFKQSRISMPIPHIYILGHFVNFMAIFRYHKHRHISRIFLRQIFVSNQVCGLSVRTSWHHATNLHKLTLFIENFTVCIDLCNFEHCLCELQPFLCELIIIMITGNPSPSKELLTSLTLPVFWVAECHSAGNPPESCLQCWQWPLNSTKIDPPRVRKRLQNLPVLVSRTPSSTWLLSHEWTEAFIRCCCMQILLRNGQEWKILDSKYQRKINFMSNSVFQTFRELKL